MHFKLSGKFQKSERAAAPFPSLTGYIFKKVKKNLHKAHYFCINTPPETSPSTLSPPPLFFQSFGSATVLTILDGTEN